MTWRSRINNARTKTTQMLCVAFLIALAGCSATTAPMVKTPARSDDELWSQDINEYKNEERRERDRAALMETLTASHSR